MTDPVDTLRRAAEKVRGAAEAATPGPWEMVDNGGPMLAAAYGSPADGDALAGYNNWRDGDYAAALHPGVGEALADWLDTTAFLLDKGAIKPATALPERALAVARLLLGNQQ